MYAGDLPWSINKTQVIKGEHTPSANQERAHGLKGPFSVPHQRNTQNDPDMWDEDPPGSHPEEAQARRAQSPVGHLG